jgi:uncharacterized membrane protein
MSWWRQWREDTGSADVLARWRAAGALDAAAWARSRQLLGPAPAPALWRAFLEQSSLWLAAGLLAAAAICFVAANWDQLGRFGRLYGLQVALVLATGAALRLGLARPAGQAALVLAGVLLGGVLALVGQTYQTGADTWELFALWAALLLPWLVAAAATAMTLLWLLVAHVAAVLWLGEWLGQGQALLLVVGLADLALAWAWHALGGRVPGLRGRTGPRLLATSALVLLSLAALTDIVGRPFEPGAGIAAWLLAVALVGWAAWRRPRDLLLLALVALSVVVVDTFALGRLLLLSRTLLTFGVGLLALSVLVQVGWATARLRRLARAESTPA